MATILFEEWRDVVGYEKLYEVSNFGEVKSYRQNKILKPQLSKGYHIVCLTKNKKEKSPSIHRLVAIAFIDGKSAPYLRADYVLRAMIIPEGEHKIEFRFEPNVYYVGNKISFAGSLILILSLIGIGIFELIKHKSKIINHKS